MARKVNYSKRIGKIKAQLDELVNDIENGSKKETEEVVEQKVKISDIDFENEDVATLMKIQTRLVRAINQKNEELIELRFYTLNGEGCSAMEYPFFILNRSCLVSG